MELPLCPSELVCKILERDGFERAAQSGRRKKGSRHRTYRKHVQGRTLVVVVVLAKKELPRGTLRSILRQAAMTDEHFLGLYRECK